MKALWVGQKTTHQHYIYLRQEKTMLALSDFLLEHGKHQLGYINEETVAVEGYKEIEVDDKVTL